MAGLGSANAVGLLGLLGLSGLPGGLGLLEKGGVGQAEASAQQQEQLDQLAAKVGDAHANVRSAIDKCKDDRAKCNAANPDKGNVFDAGRPINTPKDPGAKPKPGSNPIHDDHPPAKEPAAAAGAPKPAEEANPARRDARQAEDKAAPANAAGPRDDVPPAANPAAPAAPALSCAQQFHACKTAARDEAKDEAKVPDARKNRKNRRN